MNIADLSHLPPPAIEHGPVTVYGLGSCYSADDERYERAYAVPNVPSVGLDRYVEKARRADASLRADSKAWLATVPDGTVVGHIRAVRKSRSNTLPVEEEFGIDLDPVIGIAEWGRFISDSHPDVGPHGVSLPLLQAVIDDAEQAGLDYMVASMTEYTHDIMQWFDLGHTRFTHCDYRQIWYQATWTLPGYWRIPDGVDIVRLDFAPGVSSAVRPQPSADSGTRGLRSETD